MVYLYEASSSLLETGAEVIRRDHFAVRYRKEVVDFEEPTVTGAGVELTTSTPVVET